MDICVDAVRRWSMWALDEVSEWQDTAPDGDKLNRAREFLLTPLAEVGRTAGRGRKPTAR
jgi:hypothetical protein